MAGGADIALLNLPVLLVSTFVTDSVAVAQWGLTRVVAGLMRVLCVHTTLPLAAELGHDHAIGAREPCSGFTRAHRCWSRCWRAPWFRVCWRSGRIFSRFGPTARSRTTRADHDVVDRCGAAAPSILALGYANYSDRGELLVRAKALQLVVFLVLSAILTPPMGLLGAAIAIVASELLIQFGVLGRIVIGQTLQHRAAFVFLAAVMVTVALAGWALGTAIRLAMPAGRGRCGSSSNAGYGWLSSQLRPVRSRSNACARLTEAIPH